MTTFDDVISKAKSMAGVASKKTSDFIDVTRLKLEASELDKEFSSMLEGLGRLVYDAQKAEESVDGLVDDCIAKLDEKQLQINAIRAKIDAFRLTVHCKTCGTPNPDDALFCKKCGARLVP